MRKDFNYNMSSYEFTTFSREDNYNGSLMIKKIFFQPLDVTMRKKQAQQQEPPPEDLHQEVEILKGNSFTLPEIAFSKFDIKRHIKQIQTEHIRKRQIVQEAEQFKKCLRCFLFYQFAAGVPSYSLNPDPRPYFRPIFILTSWKD